jgi:hypothetical protein
MSPIPAHDQGLLATLAGLYLGALVLEFFADYGQALLTTLIGQRVMYDLRLRSSAISSGSASPTTIRIPSAGS